MSLSDCPKCWDTPCECGYMYKDYSVERKKDIAESAMGEKVYTEKQMRTAFEMGWNIERQDCFELFEEYLKKLNEKL